MTLTEILDLLRTRRLEWAQQSTAALAKGDKYTAGVLSARAAECQDVLSALEDEEAAA